MGAGYAIARGDERRESIRSDRARAQALDNPLLPLRATTVGEALDLGFQLLRSRAGLLAGLAATFYLPIQALDLFLRLTVAQNVDRSNPLLIGMGIPGLANAPGWMVLIAVLQRVALSLLGISCGYLVMAMTRGESLRYRTLVAFALKRAWVSLVIVVTVAAITLLSSCLPFFGVIILSSWTFAASVVAGAERLGPFASIGRSITLARASAGPSLMMFLGIVVLTLLVRAITFAGPAVLLATLSMPEAVRVVVEQISSVLLILTPLLTACLAATAYLSMRTRAEGLDVRYRLGEMADG